MSSSKLMAFRAFNVAALGLVALSGCSGNKRGGPVPYEVSNFGKPDQIELGSEVIQYRIAPGDMLTINVYQVPDLSRVVEVDSEGTFDYPLLGRINARGMSPGELRELLTKRLGEQYLQSPSIEVSLKSTVTNQVTVDGSVTAPGLYPIPPGTTLIRAIAMARGTAADANLRRVVVFRQVDGRRMAAAFDLLDIRRGLATDPEIYSRDIIVVDGATARKTWTDMLSALPLVALFRPF